MKYLYATVVVPAENQYQLEYDMNYVVCMDGDWEVLASFKELLHAEDYVHLKNAWGKMVIYKIS